MNNALPSAEPRVQRSSTSNERPAAATPRGELGTEEAFADAFTNIFRQSYTRIENFHNRAMDAMQQTRAGLEHQNGALVTALQALSRETISDVLTWASEQIASQQRIPPPAPSQPIPVLSGLLSYSDIRAGTATGLVVLGHSADKVVLPFKGFLSAITMGVQGSPLSEDSSITLEVWRRTPSGRQHAWHEDQVGLGTPTVTHRSPHHSVSHSFVPRSWRFNCGDSLSVQASQQNLVFPSHGLYGLSVKVWVVCEAETAPGETKY